MAWIGPALSLASSFLGGRNKAKAAWAPYKMAKEHYKEGKQRISDQAYLHAFNMLAPGFMQGGQSTVGSALVQQALGLLQNPGQIGPQHQERIAEAQNRMMGMLRAAMPGMAMQAGVAPDMNTAAAGAGVPGAMYTAGLLNAQNQANEALRQLATMQEGLRRQDIGMGQNIYSALLAPILQKQLGEAQTLIGAPIPQMQASQAGGGLASMLGGVGNFLGALGIGK